MKTARNQCLAAVLLLAAACGSPPPPATGLPPLPEDQEAVSLLGQPLLRPTVAGEAREELERNLAEARAAWREDPRDLERIIWLGRRQAYLGRYRDAVRTYTEGLRHHPDEPRLLRHRGHRYLTLRLLDRARADLARAAELVQGRPDRVEADGIPNPSGQPRSTLHFNIWYHLGLARYLAGDLAGAAEAWQACLEVSHNDDSVCATANWLNLVLRMLGREDEAAALRQRITPAMDLQENTAYHRILLLHKGDLDLAGAMGEPRNAVERATLGFGVAGWLFCEGREEEGMTLLASILRLPSWSAFGYLAAEAEWSRRAGEPPPADEGLR